MIKFCIVLALLVAVAQSAQCAYNENIKGSSAPCGCVNAGTNDIEADDKYCKKTAANVKSVVAISGISACTVNLKVAAIGNICKTKDDTAAGTKICQIGEYTVSLTDNLCTAFPGSGGGCTKGEGIKCATCSTTIFNQCATCNTGYETPASTACTKSSSSSSSSSSSTTSSSMSLGIQTVLIIGIMNFM